MAMPGRRGELEESSLLCVCVCVCVCVLQVLMTLSYETGQGGLLRRNQSEANSLCVFRAPPRCFGANVSRGVGLRKMPQEGEGIGQARVSGWGWLRPQGQGLWPCLGCRRDTLNYEIGCVSRNEMRVDQGLGWAWEKAFTVMQVGWGLW